MMQNMKLYIVKSQAYFHTILDLDDNVVTFGVNTMLLSDLIYRTSLSTDRKPSVHIPSSE